MRDVYSIFGTLLALGIAFPGWLFAWWLIFPQRVERAESQLTDHTGRCLRVGLLATVPTILAVLVLINVAVPFAQVLAVAIALSALAFAALGAAGLTLRMARQLQRRSAELSESAAYLRAAIALELAAAFPFIGWLLVIPFTILYAFGAAILATLPQRQPATAATAEPLTIHLEDHPATSNSSP